MAERTFQRDTSAVAGPTDVPWRSIFADLAMLATIAAVLALFAISAITLEHFGIAYISSGGGPFAKVHPSFLLAAAALAFRCLASRHPFRTARRLAFDDPGVVLLSLSIVLTGLYAAVVSKTPVTGVFDTFVLPMMFFLLLRDLDPKLRRRLALLVGVMLAINSVMAIMEFFGHFHFIKFDFDPNVSADPTTGDFDWKAEIALDWRPIALFGHPLVNGLVVQAAIFCLLARGSRWLAWIVKGPLLALLCVSMLTFGARTSLVLALVFGAWLVVDAATRSIGHGARLELKHVAFALLAISLSVPVLSLAADTGVFDRTLERFTTDAGSAKSRLVMFDLFQHVSLTDLILGPDKDVVATWQRIEGLEFGIESSWVGLVLTYGLVVTATIVLGLVVFSRSVMRASGPGAGVTLLAFFLAVSGSASLSSKTTVLAETSVLIQLFLYPDRRRDAASIRPPAAAGSRAAR